MSTLLHRYDIISARKDAVPAQADIIPNFERGVLLTSKIWDHLHLLTVKIYFMNDI